MAYNKKTNRGVSYLFIHDFNKLIFMNAKSAKKSIERASKILVESMIFGANEEWCVWVCVCE